MDVIKLRCTSYALGSGSTLIVYSHLWNATTQEIHELSKLCWLDPYVRWGLGEGARIIWPLKPWWFRNAVVNHPDDVLNFPWPFWKEMQLLLHPNATYFFHLTTSNYVHGNLLVRLGGIIIHWFTVILHSVACDDLNLKLVNGVIFSVT